MFSKSQKSGRRADETPAADVPETPDETLPDAFLGLSRSDFAAGFPAAAYLELNPDVAAIEADPLEHYIAHGWREGRRARPDFDPAYYLATHLGGRRDVDPLAHYLLDGKREGLATQPPAPDAGPVRSPEPVSVPMPGAATGDDEAEAAEKARSLALWERSLDEIWKRDILHLATVLGHDTRALADEKSARHAREMFDADSYREARGLGPEIPDAQCLERYFVFDLPAEMAPGPLFDEAHYRAAAAAAGLPAIGETPAFAHWLTHGLPARVVPTPVFDPEAYLALNPDLADYPGWLFDHFLFHGLYEGRRFTPTTIVGAPTPEARIARGQRLLGRLSRASGDEMLGAILGFAGSEAMGDLIAEARALDPNVGGDRFDFALMPPWHDAEYDTFRKVVAAVPEGPFDHVVLVPFCKMGGADFVSGLLSQALAKGGDRVLVLRTDQTDWSRPDWFPGEAETVDLSPWLATVPRPLATRCLYELLLRLRPRGVFNVNSRIGFDTFVRFGSRMSAFTDLYAYFFCADRDADGIEVGYPVWYFADTFPWLTAALVDSDDLGRTLVRRYALSPQAAARVRTLRTPAMDGIDPAAEPVARAQIDGAAGRERPVILWAGRLDRQKRFDLLVGIARAMPDLDFRAWGKAVLDAPPDLDDLPENLSMEGTFRRFDELPLEEADGYLYTSDWDGIPTMVIELGALGMPIVASAAGGVPEVIDDTTGWTVPVGAPVAAHVDALREMLADPDRRLARARALKAKVAREHSAETYSATLRSVIADRQGDAAP